MRIWTGGRGPGELNGFGSLWRFVLDGGGRSSLDDFAELADRLRGDD